MRLELPEGVEDALRLRLPFSWPSSFKTLFRYCHKSVPPVLEQFMGQTLPRGNGTIDALPQKHPRIKHLEGLFSDGAANE